MPEAAAEPASLRALLTWVQSDFPEISFVESTRFSWHAGKHELVVKKTARGQKGAWSLLHELGHALLKHTDYQYDIELLQMEAAAWAKAHELAERYGIEIDEDHVQDCLDTYRDWLHLRATCPTCHSRSLQASPRAYHCFNCGAEWQVSRSRLCRPYRLKTV